MDAVDTRGSLPGRARNLRAPSGELGSRGALCHVRVECAGPGSGRGRGANVGALEGKRRVRDPHPFDLINAPLKESLDGFVEFTPLTIVCHTFKVRAGGCARIQVWEQKGQDVTVSLE